MNILVCVKQVPEPEALVRVTDTGSPGYECRPSRYVMNRFDEFAVEEALLIREHIPQSSLDVITVGPSDWSAVLKRALGMGADQGIRIETDRGHALTAFEIASGIASVVADRGYDLILAGVMSEDLMQGQVGPMIAELLSMRCATCIISEEIDEERHVVRTERELAGGLRERLELDLPAVLTVQSGINKPRYPSLSNILRANKQALEVVPWGSLPTPQPREDLIQVGYPQKSDAARFLTGSPTDKARELLNIFREKSLTR